MSLNGVTEPIFGNWYIDEEIGSGAFGTVYRIKREDFGKEYYSALKVIRIPQSDSELRSVRSEFEDDQSLSDYYSNFVQDFAKEIELMAELKGNSNIVSFEDHAFIRNDDGIGWTILIRMELLTPFVEYQRENEIDNQAIVKLGMDICSALELCEKRNIIHRDIKPDNIFISKDGDYELGDFGIARELEKTTGGLSKKGTYSYMAPEVYLGKPYNNTVDIYSLGIVMYKLLNRNRAPFMPDYPNPITFTDRENALQMRMRGDEMPDIKDIPKVLNDIVKKACAFESKERYQSAGEFKQALLDALNADAPTVNGDETQYIQPAKEPSVTDEEITVSIISDSVYGSNEKSKYNTISNPDETKDETVGPAFSVIDNKYEEKQHTELVKAESEIALAEENKVLNEKNASKLVGIITLIISYVSKILNPILRKLPIKRKNKQIPDVTDYEKTVSPFSEQSVLPTEKGIEINFDNNKQEQLLNVVNNSFNRINASVFEKRRTKKEMKRQKKHRRKS